MRKQLKKALSMALSAAMVVTMGSGVGFNKASADEAKTYSATLEGTDTSNWSNLTSTATQITGDGTYTVTSTVPSAGFQLDNLYLNIPSLGADVPEAKISDISMKVDGEAVTFVKEGNVTLSLNGKDVAAPAAEAPKANIEKTGDNKGALQILFNNPWTPLGCFNSADYKVSKDVSVTFTISGLGGSAPVEPATGTATDVPSGSATNVPSGTATETPTAPPVSNIIFDDAINWTYGGDDDCRLQLYNQWGLPLGEPDAKIADKAFDRIIITFKASGVEDALKAAGITEITGALNYSIDGAERWPDGTDVTITKDGEYVIDHTLPKECGIGNFMAIRFNCLDKTVKQSEEEGGQTEGPLKFSDVRVTLYGSGAPIATPSPAPTKDPNAGDPSYKATWDEKGIHAFLFYQTTSWDYRNVYTPKTDGKEDSYHFIKAGGEDVTNTAQVVDAFLTKNGEYTVSISGIDLSGADKFNMLGISTDINKELYPDVKITEEKVSIDGTVVTSDNDLTPIGKEDDKTNNFLVINEWDGDRDTNGGTIHYPLGKLNADEELLMPENSIEITFKVEGLDKVLQDIKTGNYIDPETGDKIQNDKVEAPDVQPSASPSVQPSSQPTKAPEQIVGVAQGKSFTSGNFTYKVTKAATTSKNGTVTVSLAKKGKKAAKLTVGATVKKSGATYTINAVAKNGFKGAKAKQVTLGKNIKKIPAGAFAGCKKLSKLTLKAKLSSVAKKSFKGCKKKITVKGTAKKANVKKLKKSGYKKFK